MTWREVAWEVAGDAALNEVVDARVRVTLADDLRELTEVACGIRKGTHNNGLFDIFVQAAHAAAERRRRLCKRAQTLP